VATDWKDIIVDVDALWHAEEHPVSDSISADLGDRGHISPDIRVQHFLHWPVVLLVGRREDQHILPATGGQRRTNGERSEQKIHKEEDSSFYDRCGSGWSDRRCYCRLQHGVGSKSVLVFSDRVLGLMSWCLLSV
jgi:hypothetical protein